MTCDLHVGHVYSGDFKCSYLKERSCLCVFTIKSIHLGFKIMIKQGADMYHNRFNVKVDPGGPNT